MGLATQSALATQHDDQQVEELPYRADLRVDADGLPTPYRLAMAWRYLNFDLDQGAAADELCTRFRFYERMANEKHFATAYLAALDDVKRMDRKIESAHRMQEAKRHKGEVTAFRILTQLNREPRSVEWLMQRLSMTEPGVRKRLRWLRDRGRVQFDAKSSAWRLSKASISLSSQGDPTTTEPRSVGPTQNIPGLPGSYATGSRP